MRKLAILLLLLMLMLMPLLTACHAADTGGDAPAGPDEQGAIFSGKAAAILGDQALIIGAGENAADSGLYLLPLSGLDISGSGAAEPADLAPGALVEISYSGMILESFPAQFGGAAALRVTGREPNLPDLYLAVLRDLYAVDPGLNDGVSMLAFDLSQASNLSAAEQSALLYAAGYEFGLETVSAGFEQLVEQGLIDSEQLYFASGLLIAFEVGDQQADSFTFSASKWRGGLGAYFFVDCLARLKGYDWSYAIGQEMVS